ncbi:helix-turn-helix domain-containing protein [Parabacteroides sp. AGMB00274]|jgi:DNA-binding XRE family transcriptional regulator|uniref:Helix-turn-helix domain-containing protein n=1 Tax=Parabacteroides faecalis TaxID=2924040 RepID=A0ABT0C3B1_9BACT|nr:MULTISPECIES: helix-turn-helix transcriptional regulator [Bacteroidales]MCJ2381508.1 helix-turn-helix domain-containing protein [Parabacteroides faecalis]
MAIDNNLNRLKVVLCEKKRTSKWLAQQLGVNPTTVSKWCTNTTQPDLYTIAKIADLLQVDKRELLQSSN